MRRFFLKIYFFITLIIIAPKTAYSEVFIVAEINQEVITNIDLNFEERYLRSLNPNLQKLDQARITEYAKNSLINEKIKKIEIEKRFEILQNRTVINKVISDLYAGIGISDIEQFKEHLRNYNINFYSVGFAFDEQKENQIPKEDFDYKLDFVLTEKQLYTFIWK